MAEAQQFWIVMARQKHDREMSAYAMAYPADRTVAASEVAEDFSTKWLGDFELIRVAPVKAPTSWDVFDVAPEQIKRRVARA
jgi:hypothetical protein